MDSDSQSDAPTPEENPSASGRGFAAFWQELRQRKVVRAGIAYLVVGLAIMEGGDIVLGNLGAPQWVVTALILLVIAGFPIALVVSWVYELTPQGIRNTDTVRDEQAERSGEQPSRARHPALFLFFAAAVPTLIFGAGTLYFFLRAKTAEDELQFVTQAEFEELTDKSIAVLPFETISSGEDDEVFSIGLHTDLVSMLMGIGDLTTIERSSTLKYRDSSQSKQSIARELSVRTLLTGTVQWSARGVRVSVQLIDALNNNNLWADVFSKELQAFSDLLDIQAAISREIADQLEVHLSPEEQERIDKSPTQSLQAWEAFVKGRELLDQDNKALRDETIEQFRKAVTLDPEFALAWAYLGLAHLKQSPPAGRNQGETDERKQDADEAIARALELDASLPEAYFAQGRLLRMGENHEEPRLPTKKRCN